MDFDELARALDNAYEEHYTPGREEGLEEFGRLHSADICSALRGGRTLEEMVAQAKISPDSYWAEQVARGMDARDRLNILERRTKSLEEDMDELERMIANLATKEDTKQVIQASERRLTKEIQASEERVTKEIHAAEDHLIDQLKVVNAKASGEMSDPQKSVVKRKRD